MIYYNTDKEEAARYLNELYDLIVDAIIESEEDADNGDITKCSISTL